MNAVWNIVGVTAVVALVAVAAPLTAQEKVIEKTKDAIVKGATVAANGVELAADKTKAGLSKTGEVMTDAWITTRVHERFVGASLLKDSDISVDTSKHVVTLKGTVITAAGRKKAASIAQRTEGVHRVVNRMTIGPKRA